MSVSKAAAMAVIAGLVVSGCGKDGGNSAAPTPTASASAVVGPVVPATKLAAIKLPVPASAPAGSQWEETGSLEDGYRSASLKSGGDIIIPLTILDCNLAKATDPAKVPDNHKDEYALCSARPDQTYKGYGMFATEDNRRAFLVGHLMINISIGWKAVDKVKPADLQDMFDKLDPATLAKL